MAPKKTIIFLGDGMADEPIAELGGRTPLQAAATPAMDRIAREGASGTLFTLPAAFPTSSDVANMSVLGCDLATEFCGRGPLEAAGRGIPLGTTDIAFRLNLTTVRDGQLTDFSGGHPSPEDSAALMATLRDHFGSETVMFHDGVSYRNLLVLSGDAYHWDVETEKPDDNQGECVADLLPSAKTPDGEKTASFLRSFIALATPLLERHPVNIRRAQSGLPLINGVWPWSGGRAGARRTLNAKYGIERSAVISAVDVIIGLGRCLGMDIMSVEGATGYIDTNYEGKADAAIAAIKTHDFVYVHVEAIDEVSHEQKLDLKLKAIEDFDRRLIGRVLEAIGPDVTVAVLPDHPVPIALGKHTRKPVPVAVRMAGMTSDGVQTFDEVACLKGSLGAMENGDFMTLLVGRPLPV